MLEYKKNVKLTSLAGVHCDMLELFVFVTLAAAAVPIVGYIRLIR